MIDTVKIYTMINKDVYDKIRNNSIVKTSYHSATGEVYYNIINDHLKGSYDSSLSVRVDSGVKYRFTHGYVLEVDGSYHKIIKGYNSHNGFYGLKEIVEGFISLIENAYNVKLPSFNHWFFNRIDISLCFDLGNQANVINYIMNLKSCRYPRRGVTVRCTDKNDGLDAPGSVTTLKIYNKYKEFKVHDIKKFKGTDFDLINYLDTIKGFVRFEVEIKKRRLVAIYNKKYIRVKDLCYNDLRNIWSDEFMKLLNFYESDLKIVRSKEEVFKRLITMYGSRKGKRLYNFYLSLVVDGIDIVKSVTSHNMYYTNVRELKKVGVDFSQLLDINFENVVDFNPFEWKEVL